MSEKKHQSVTSSTYSGNTESAGTATAAKKEKPREVDANVKAEVLWSEMSSSSEESKRRRMQNRAEKARVEQDEKGAIRSYVAFQLDKGYVLTFREQLSSVGDPLVRFVFYEICSIGTEVTM